MHVITNQKNENKSCDMHIEIPTSNLKDHFIWQSDVKVLWTQ